MPIHLIPGVLFSHGIKKLRILILGDADALLKKAVFLKSGPFCADGVGAEAFDYFVGELLLQKILHKEGLSVSAVRKLLADRSVELFRKAEDHKKRLVRKLWKNGCRHVQMVIRHFRSAVIGAFPHFFK